MLKCGLVRVNVLLQHNGQGYHLPDVTATTWTLGAGRSEFNILHSFQPNQSRQEFIRIRSRLFNLNIEYPTMHFEC